MNEFLLDLSNYHVNTTRHNCESCLSLLVKHVKKFLVPLGPIKNLFDAKLFMLFFS